MYNLSDSKCIGIGLFELYAMAIISSFVILKTSNKIKAYKTNTKLFY